ncbi:nickel pincer cofactor biosynthesis protein LarC [candidate division WOR-3 bacterium]|nr:nickel pincer cofactor biosynthesis protein LarC [candidate division WOR-3 bacterium]
MKVLLFDPIGGVSGDMLLAALIDLGVSPQYLKEVLSFVPGSALKVGRVNRCGVSARMVSFTIKKHISEKQFMPLIKKSRLPAKVKDRAIEIIGRIFAAEKKVHHLQHLHLHELADADTLLDITGVLAAIEYLKVDRIFSRPAKAGSGFISTVEGRMPAFNFATAELLKKFPVHFLPVPAELTTPTGAAILSTIATPCDELLISKIERVGLGAGSNDLKEHPNLLRVFLGKIRKDTTDECTVIETNIDDMNPQDYEMVFEKLYEAGALDVFLTPTIMKRSRPGILLTVLCQENLDRMIEVLFSHTTSIGFRVGRTQRIKFDRRFIRMDSPYGKVRVKIIEHDGKNRFSLEYRDLKRIAEREDSSVAAVRNDLMRLLRKEFAQLKRSVHGKS